MIKLKQCKYPYCKQLTKNINSYCDTHQQYAPKRFQIDFNKQRSSPTARGYNYKWIKYRKEYLKEHPICIKCGSQATVIDHIIPHRGDQHLFWKHSNHQPLCKRCHDKKTLSGR